jgi:hypothetical protein
MHIVHVRLHQQDAAAVEALEVFVEGRVGDRSAVEAGAFILDGDLGLFGADGGLDLDGLGAVELVAVLDGVDQGLFEGELDAEEGVGEVGVLLDLVENAFLDRPALGKV